MAHILIDAATGSPVPLPFHTLDPDLDEPVTIYDFEAGEDGSGRLHILYENGAMDTILAGYLDLEVVTEAEYMERQP